MLKRELKINLKSFIIWSSILIGLSCVIVLIYPYIINTENMESMEDMLKMFPEEVLKAFNMDLASIDNPFGWLKTEGFVFILLIITCYSAILGSNILLKEESDKTIEYLNMLPITRNNTIIKKSICGIFYILLMIFLVGILNFVALSIVQDFDVKQYLLLSITPLFPSIVAFFLAMFISTFTNKTKKMLGVSLGIVFISYILQTLSQISEKVEFLKYFSIFTLADIRNTIQNIEINPVMVIISIILAVIFFFATKINYNKKEFI